MIVAGTGHRPDKFGGWNNTDAAYKLMMVCMNWMEKRQPDIIISGFALGFDMAWASAAYHLQVPYVAAIPCQNQDCKWSHEDRDDYQRLLGGAEKVVMVSDKPYFNGCMQIRNEWMVRNSQLLIACWNKTEGGTKNCIDYAKKQKKEIRNIWKMWEAINKPKEKEEIFEV